MWYKYENMFKYGSLRGIIRDNNSYRDNKGSSSTFTSYVKQLI